MSSSSLSLRSNALDSSSVVSMFCWLVVLSENALEIVAVKQLNSRRSNLSSDVSAKSSERFCHMLSMRALSLSRVLRTTDRSWHRSGPYPVRTRTWEMLDQI